MRRACERSTASGATSLVNGGVVWESDVAKDRDGDTKDLDLEVPRGSTVAPVSKNGDPIWVRKLEVDYESESEPGSR